MTAWSSTKLPLLDRKKAINRFFLRTSDSQEQILELFEGAELIKIPGIVGETGVLTKAMTEEEYDYKAAKLSNVIQMIRVA